MRKQKKLILEQLDRKLLPFYGSENVVVPSKGWIQAIRTALNMTQEQLGNKMNITKQGILKMEKSEAADSITIRSMKEIGKAMDMTFVYGFVPHAGSLEKLLEEKAHALAKQIVLRTNQYMVLENQGNHQDRIADAIEELTQEIKREMRRSIWD